MTPCRGARCWAACLLYLAAAGWGGAGAVAGEVLERVQTRGTLKVCIWPDYYGITYRDARTGRLTGIDAELSAELAKDLGAPLTELKVDGGASRNNLLMQFQADILGVPVDRPQVIETTALGAAYLAGLAVGVWDSKEELVSSWKLQNRFEPTMDPEKAAGYYKGWRKAVKHAMHWLSDED